MKPNTTKNSNTISHPPKHISNFLKAQYQLFIEEELSKIQSLNLSNQSDQKTFSRLSRTYDFFGTPMAFYPILSDQETDKTYKLFESFMKEIQKTPQVLDRDKDTKRQTMILSYNKNLIRCIIFK